MRAKETTVANFLFVYRNQPETFAKLTPEDMQRQLQRWQTWIREGIAARWMINPGDGLTRDGKIVDSKKLVADFSIVAAESLDAAANLAKGCPALLIGGTVEVRPLAGYTANG
jgi:YCII-related domain